MWAWVREARDEERVGAPSAWTDEAGWAGMLSLPRELTPGADGELVQRSARELLALRRSRRIAGKGEASAERVVDLGEVGRASELTVSLEPGGRLRLRTAADGSEYLDIVHAPAGGEVIVDRDHASLDPRAKRGRSRLPVGHGTANLRIFLDHSVVEIFTESGRALTQRFHPVGEGPWRVQPGASGVPSVGYAVEAWDLTA